MDDEPETTPLGDHPHVDPGDGRTECYLCGKFVHDVIHSCKGVPVTRAAEARVRALIDAVRRDATQEGEPGGAEVAALKATREYIVQSRHTGNQGEPYQGDPMWEWTSGLIDGLDLAIMVVRQGEPVNPIGMIFPLENADRPPV